MNAPAEFDLRCDWSLEEILAIHDAPLLELIARASAVHRRHFDPNDVQKAALLSIKTGGCPEDCSYCPQSAHHREVKLDRVELMDPSDVLAAARTAREAGADRFCMGAAWRSAPEGRDFEAVLEMVAAFANSAWRPASRSACSRGAGAAAHRGRARPPIITISNRPGILRRDHLHPHLSGPP